MLHFEMHLEGGTKMKLSWRELYRAALLEVQSEQLRQRIDDAENAIFERSEELRRAGNQVNEEQGAMADALRALRVLALSECQAGHLRVAEVELDKGRVTS
jgi:hypothetical protein